MIHLSPTERSKHVIFVSRHEYVRGRSIVILICYGKVVYRELSWQVSFLVERICEFPHTFPLVVLKSVGNISLCKQMRIQICCSLRTHTQPETVHEVLRKNGIYRTYINFTWFFAVGRCFNKVLYKRFCYEQHKLESFGRLHLFQKIVHCAFFLGQWFGTHGIPIFIVFHHSVGQQTLFAQKFEFLFGYFFQRIIAVIRISLDMEFCKGTYNTYLHNHVIVYDYLFARRKSFKFLGNIHVAYKVDRIVMRQVQSSLMYTISRIGHYVKTSVKAEVL